MPTPNTNNYHTRLTNPPRIWPAFAACGLAALLVACAQPASTPSAPRPIAAPHQSAEPCNPTAPHFRLLGEQRWGLDQHFGGVPVGGLSSIDYSPQHGAYFMVSDDRSVHDAARFYQARIHYDQAGLHQVTLERSTPLLTPAGTPYPSMRAPTPGVAVPDAEALRLLPGGEHMVWTSEGDFARGFGPALQEARLDGAWVQPWPLPGQLQLPQPPSATTGPRNNMSLEGMAISTDQRSLWLAMEGALKQDGPLPGMGRAGGPVRITAYDLATRQPTQQLAYLPDALPPDHLILPLIAVNGVSEILQDGPDHLLVLERAYVLGKGFSVRLYRISTRIAGDGASDTLAIDALTPSNHRPAHKTLVLDFADIGLQTVDNIEGMTWGPPLPSGERVLVLVSDNNFNPAEVTQFIALAEEKTCGTRTITPVNLQDKTATSARQ